MRPAASQDSEQSFPPSRSMEACSRNPRPDAPVRAAHTRPSPRDGAESISPHAKGRGAARLHALCATTLPCRYRPPIPSSVALRRGCAMMGAWARWRSRGDGTEALCGAGTRREAAPDTARGIPREDGCAGSMEAAGGADRVAPSEGRSRAPAVRVLGGLRHEFASVAAQRLRLSGSMGRGRLAAAGA